MCKYLKNKNYIYIADQGEDRLTRRSMVRLGVRVIHKITSEARAQPIIEPNPPTLSKSLRLRLSPKALKLASKFSTSVDENQHRALNGQRSGSGGLDAMSRIDIDKPSKPDIRQSTFFTTKVIANGELQLASAISNLMEQQKYSIAVFAQYSLNQFSRSTMHTEIRFILLSIANYYSPQK